MRIQEVHIENLYGIESLTATPRGDKMTLKGRNAIGKTSVLKAIRAAFTGSRDADTVHQGAQAGAVKIITDRLEIVRVFGAATKVTVRDLVDDVAIKSPAAFLKTLAGGLVFDPLRFVTMSPKERLTMLATLADRPVNRDVFDALLTTATRERTLSEDEKLAAFVRLQLLIPPFIERPALELAREISDALSTVVKDRTNAAAALEYSASAFDHAAAAMTGTDGYAPAIEYLLKLARAARLDADAARAIARAHGQAQTVVDDVLPRVLIRDRQLDVDGLAFGPEGVTWKGLGMTSLSGAERLLVATKIAEKALGSELRVMLVDGLEALDNVSFAIFDTWARLHDIQIIGTRVTSDVNLVVDVPAEIAAAVA